ncbi:hypothetical protein QBC38DRAFT_494137 [Podospora fimiseda]|uniref:F-box domain-containing protein n=1 Tax=Podospora fimiseda TaxID=252190 RepID=A0AAN7BG92_9PEZI|nr:hypothetical protein QBC38DRAFT_494137 [Podospora fimiseda]
MESLPFEILTEIASHLPKNLSDGDSRLVRPNIAATSRKWQSVIEPLIFSTLDISNTELPKFASAFSGSQSQRRALLKSLKFKIILPTYTKEAYCVFEINEDRATNNFIASNAVYVSHGSR